MKTLTLATSLLIAPLALGVASMAEARDRGYDRGGNVVVVENVRHPAPAAHYRHGDRQHYGHERGRGHHYGHRHGHGHHHGHYYPHRPQQHYHYYQSGHSHLGVAPVIAGGVIGGVIGHSVGQGDPVPVVAGTIIGSVIGHEMARH